MNPKPPTPPNDETGLLDAIVAKLADPTGNWDCDDSMDRGEMMARPFSQALLALSAHHPKAIGHLVFSVLRRSLLHWDVLELSEPAALVAALESPLADGAAPVDECQRLLDSLTRRVAEITARGDTSTSFMIALVSGTEAFVHSLAYSKTRIVRLALYAISSAGTMTEHSPRANADDFREWFTEVAVPAAFHCQRLDASQVKVRFEMGRLHHDNRRGKLVWDASYGWHWVISEL